MGIILHADMNSYFASVEQQANPFLRGKPVAICSRISKNACVIASSIEAKKLGVKTGFRLSEARMLVPELVALEVDPVKVRAVTKRIFGIFADFTSAIEPYSIDEAFLGLTGHVRDFKEAREAALAIKTRISAEAGEWLKCSIGIAPTRWLAKFAGELQKPDGLTVLKKEDLPRIYAGRDLEEAWGIADGWKRRLNGIGINTLNELLRADPLELKRLFGIGGYSLWRDISGLGTDEICPSEAAPKSIGHSYVFHRRTSKEGEILAIMMKLCERVGRRLRAKGMEARRISLGWSSDAWGINKNRRLRDAVFESYGIFRSARALFSGAWKGETVGYMAVTASDLAPAVGQGSLFQDRERMRRVTHSLDSINDRYGEFTVFRGQMWGTREDAPERVGFRQTVPAEYMGLEAEEGELI